MLFLPMLLSDLPVRNSQTGFPLARDIANSSLHIKFIAPQPLGLEMVSGCQ